jgi:hypothetical protein
MNFLLSNLEEKLCPRHFAYPTLTIIISGHTSLVVFVEPYENLF